MKFIDKLFGTYSERELKRIQPLVDKVLAYSEAYRDLSDDELRNKTNEFRVRINKGESLDSLLPEAYATVVEASDRVLGMRHYPVQIQGGIILHQGRIAELKTGEGKTLTATLPVYLNALSGKGVYVVTVNDYLAKRDSLNMGKLYGYLGLRTGLIVHEKKPDERRQAYNCDITYGTNNEIGFDYLRDNMVFSVSDRVQRGFNYAIVDEVDSILIDEARTPLVISGASGQSSDGYIKANEFVKSLSGKKIVEDNTSKLDYVFAKLEDAEIEEEYGEYDYVVEEKNKYVSLTAKGIEKAEKFYGLDNLSDIENLEVNHYIMRSLKAYGIFTKDVDYVVKDGKVVIVDESTGRLMDGRRYNDGIHQALEAKENVSIMQESKTLASITFQNLFRKFAKLSGMTGTAKTEEEEFRNIYGLDVIEIPTNKPVLRIDDTDKVYLTRDAKLNAIVNKIEEVHQTGQPILVGTVSVEKSEELSRLLKLKNIKHTVLNAKYHEQEAHIIAQAGRLGAVTISTNMAGRGTDILLGGNPEYLALEELKEEGFSDSLISEATNYNVTHDEEILFIREAFKKKEARIKEELRSEREKVIEAGGLFILGTERHESRRIDNQLRGRSGRQGDVGESVFMLSLEDDLMRLFGSHKFIEVCESLGMSEDEPLDVKILSDNIEKAQKKIESQYFATRKNLLDYDDVLSKQCDMIYDQRFKILSGEIDYVKLVSDMVNDYLDHLLESMDEDLTKEDLIYIMESIEDSSNSLVFPENKDMEFSKESLKKDLYNQFTNMIEELKGVSTLDNINVFLRKLVLFLTDLYWQEHMVSMEELKSSVGLEVYAQKDPKQAYKFSGYELFDEMMYNIRREVFRNVIFLYHKEIIDKNETEKDKMVEIKKVD